MGIPAAALGPRPKDWGQWRQLKCVVCSKYFQETIGTVFYGSSLPANNFMRAIASLCEGMSPRKVARVFEMDKDTVLRWLVQAAQHSEAVVGYMVHNLHLTQVQMDELYALLAGMRGEDGERQSCWVWVALYLSGTGQVQWIPSASCG